MNVLLELQRELFRLAKGKDLVLHQKDIFTLLGKDDNSASRMLLKRAVSARILRNPTRRIYVFTPNGHIDPLTIYTVAKKLRSGYFNYLSLESVLSESGRIAQLPIDRITIMTTGRSRIFELEGIGVVDFTHTKKSMDNLAKSLVWDKDTGMFLAYDETRFLIWAGCGRIAGAGTEVGHTKGDHTPRYTPDTVRGRFFKPAHFRRGNMSPIGVWIFPIQRRLGFYGRNRIVERAGTSFLGGPADRRAYEKIRSPCRGSGTKKWKRGKCRDVEG